MPDHRAARRAIERAAGDPRGWGLALASATEFWAVVAHPDASGRPSTPADARAFLAALIDAGARIWTPGPGFWERLSQLALDLGVGGARIVDLQIGLTAFDQGAVEIWTHDAAFLGVPGLMVRDPLKAP